MLPHNHHAPGLPTKLPDQPPVRDRQGRLVVSGKTRSIQKLINEMRGHHRKVLLGRRRG